MNKSISLLVISTLFLIIPTFLKAESITAKDTIFLDDTWSVDTVRVTDNIVIMDDVILTIEPGTRVEFQGPYYIYNQGTIIAMGTEADTIVFTPADTTGFHNDTTRDGCWDGIVMFNGIGAGGPDGAMIDNDTTRFSHCRFEFTKTDRSVSLAWSAIEVDYYSRVIISNCEFRYNYSSYRGPAILAYVDADIQIRDNYIHHNRALEWGGGIFIRQSAAIVTGNIIEYNQTTTNDGDWWGPGKGGGIAVEGMNPVIRDNIIRYNNAIHGSGIFMWNCFGLIEGNTISYNTGYKAPPDMESLGGGIACWNGTTARIINNRIFNNEADIGGGITVFESDPEIIGNLIVNNTGVATSGGMRAISFSGQFVNNTVAHNSAFIAGAIEFDDSDPLFMNNVIWNNPDDGGGEIKLFGYFSDLHIQNCVIKNAPSSIYGETSPTYSELITDDPGFISVSGGIGAGFGGLSGDWSVDINSPCINAGNSNLAGVKMPANDLAGNERIRHSIIDIGAYEAYIPSITAQDTIRTNTTWVADTVKVNGDVIVQDDVILSILPGTLVEFQGRYKLQVIGTLLAAGQESKPIRFTVADTSGSWNDTIPDGSWKGIRFENDLQYLEAVMNDNMPSVLRYCSFSNVKCLEDEPEGTAAVYVRYFSNLSLSWCRFYNNSAILEPASVYLLKSDVNVSHCEFFDNIANEGPAILAISSDFIINNCYFHDNTARVKGGAVRTNECDLEIRECRFIYNESWHRGGAIFLERTEALISHSLFANNFCSQRGGAIVALYENYQLINNVIVNNTANFGAGIYSVYVDNLLSVNNTICNNLANVAGGGVWTGFVNHTSINDLLYGNVAENSDNQYFLHSITADLDFRNTNLEGGTDGIQINIGQELTGSYIDIIDSFPAFIRPSEGAGEEFDGVNAIWRLRSISPCINKGTLEGTAVLEAYDFYGDPRIYDTLIDIGAVESQYGLPEILSQPDHYIGCEGDHVELVVKTRYQSSFQWYKDGLSIQGATGNTLTLENISPDDDGSYKCTVSNSFGSLETSPVYLLARSAPVFLRHPEDIWAVEGKKTIITSTASGTPPMHFQWFKDGNEIPGKIYPDLWLFDTDTDDEGVYYCTVSNACMTLQSNTVQLYMAPQICMVTVDTATNKNLVVWEKKSTAPIASYNVYRESVAAGEYEFIGNVSSSSLSEFIDENVNPVVQAYTYKITAITANGVESDLGLCDAHKTIHLLTNIDAQEGGMSLIWTDYWGFEYGTFYILRSRNQDPWENYYPIAKGNNTWIDEEGLSDDTLRYRVAVESPEPCNPTGSGKAGTGPYQHALSNLDKNKKKAEGIENVEYGTLKIYPNPFSERTSIEFPNPGFAEYRLTIRDISGKTVRISRVNGNRITVERGDLKAGLYSIELAGEKVYRDKFMVK